MNAPASSVALFLLFTSALFSTLIPSAASAAPLPDTLLYSLAAPQSGIIDARFGANVAVDGPHLVVGVPGDDAPVRDSGTVRVYDSATGELRFVIPNPSPASLGNDDLFGSVLALSGSLLVVGVPRDRLPASPYENRGSVFVYDLSSATPTVPVTSLENPLTTPASLGVEFGAAVAISGTRIVVGAPADDTRGLNAGIAYVYDLTSSHPVRLIATLFSPNPAAGDRFGSAVGISGTRVVVGAPFADTGAPDAGSAYLYDLAAGNAAVVLLNPDPAANDVFGSALALAGDRVVVGAPGDSTGAASAGSAYAFDLRRVSTHGTAGADAIMLNPSPTPGDHFGAAVAVGDGKVVVGAPGADTGASDAGSVYLYDSGRATPFATLVNPKPGAGDIFGSAVAIAAKGVLVGAPGDDLSGTNAGDAYFYPSDGTALDYPRFTLNDTGFPIGAAFGTSVGIAKGGFFDSTSIAVGAPYASVGARWSGAAYLYQLGRTSPFLALGNPHPAPGDNFGTAVAAYQSGLLVGVPSADEGGANVGVAYRYSFLIPVRPIPAIRVRNPNQGDMDHFGHAMGSDGLRTVIGAFRAAGGGKVFAGSVALSNPTGSADEFGYAVGVSGTRVIAGAPSASVGTARNAGRAYVYHLGSATPDVPILTLNNPEPAGGDRFGFAVAVSGRYAAVGAPWDDAGKPDAGSVYIYDLESATPEAPVACWRNPAGKAQDQFGHAVAMAGSLVVVGAPFDQTYGADSGAAYLYDFSTGVPAVPAATLRNPREVPRARFGYSVATEGTRVVVGAPFDGVAGFDNGAAYVFGPDTMPPADGYITFFASDPVEPGAPVCVFFDDWKDAHRPLTYVVLVDGVPMNQPTTGTTIHFQAPTAPGVHRLTGRIIDPAGNITEVQRTFTVRSSARVAGPATGIFSAPGAFEGLIGTGDGFARATVTRFGVVTARITYAGQSLSLSGRFDAAGEMTVSLRRPGKAPLQVRLRANWFAEAGAVEFEISDGGNSSIAMLRGMLSNISERALLAGRYSFLIGRDSAPSDARPQPPGYGCGTLVVSPAGRATIAGRVADGTPFTAGGVLNDASVWPLYIPLYSGAGTLAGGLRFRAQSRTDLDGVILWSRPASGSAVRYGAGFDCSAVIGGSRYTGLPAARAFTATFAGGNLLTDRTTQLPAFLGNTARRDDVLLTVQPSTGLIVGSFIHARTGQRVPTFGAILPKAASGAGFFIGPAENGAVELLWP